MFRYSFVSNTILQATITQIEGKVQRSMKKADLLLSLSLSHKDCPLVYRQCNLYLFSKAPLFCNLLNYELVYYEFVKLIFMDLSASHLLCL